MRSLDVFSQCRLVQRDVRVFILVAGMRLVDEFELLPSLRSACVGKMRSYQAPR